MQRLFLTQRSERREHKRNLEWRSSLQCVEPFIGRFAVSESNLDELALENFGRVDHSVRGLGLRLRLAGLAHSGVSVWCWWKRVQESSLAGLGYGPSPLTRATRWRKVSSSECLLVKSGGVHPQRQVDLAGHFGEAGTGCVGIGAGQVAHHRTFVRRHFVPPAHQVKVLLQAQGRSSPGSRVISISRAGCLPLSGSVKRPESSSNSSVTSP